MIGMVSSRASGDCAEDSSPRKQISVVVVKPQENRRAESVKAIATSDEMAELDSCSTPFAR